MEEVTNQIAILLEECHERGMPLPYLLVAVAINGSIMACRYVESESGEELDAEVLVKAVDDKMVLPINVMLVDANGEAVRLLITTDAATFH
jgi:hypothetical protein